MNYKTNCLSVWCPTFCKTAVKHCSAEAGHRSGAVCRLVETFANISSSPRWVLAWIIHRITLIPLKMTRKRYIWPICFLSVWSRRRSDAQKLSFAFCRYHCKKALTGAHFLQGQNDHSQCKISCFFMLSRDNWTLQLWHYDWHSPLIHTWELPHL